MLPGMELMGCQIDVPASVMHHVVKVESSYNPYAIGVVGGKLVRQPSNLAEAVATAEMLESRGFNFSLGLAQVNRYNLKKYGLADYRAAFQVCPNLLAGSRILRECHGRSGTHWGRAFSCYYSGNFTTGYRHGYVQKVEASMFAMRGPETPSLAIPVIGRGGRAQPRPKRSSSPGSTQRVEAVVGPAPGGDARMPSLLERRAGLSDARQLSPAEAAAGASAVTAVESPAPVDAAAPFQPTLTPKSPASKVPAAPARGTTPAGVADSAFVF